MDNHAVNDAEIDLIACNRTARSLPHQKRYTCVRRQRRIRIQALIPRSTPLTPRALVEEPSLDAIQQLAAPQDVDGSYHYTSSQIRDEKAHARATPKSNRYEGPEAVRTHHKPLHRVTSW
jgi:hypothetical protein